MKLYEIYFHEIGLGGKMVLGAYGALAAGTALALHKVHKDEKEANKAGGVQLANHLISRARNWANDDLGKLQEKKCSHLEFESRELHNCWDMVQKRFNKPLYASSLRKVGSGCKDKICAQTIRNEISKS